MDEKKTEPIGLLVCGGAALNVLRILERTTRDVDVIAIGVNCQSSSVKFELAEEWPEGFSEMIDQVARDLNLPMADSQGNPLPADRKWLNLGPRILFKQGLPDDYVHRLEQRAYGLRLTVYYSGRMDRIAFKLYAALTPDERSAVHFLDLFHLKPTEAEMRHALRWVISRPLPSEFREKKLPDALRVLEFDYLIPEFFP